ncbi:MAG TPA: hypothetical protein VM432_08125 [Bdellovibrionales bacterium]|nr:hypothetical protein [Bdellovibrionales bacterium]
MKKQITSLAILLGALVLGQVAIAAPIPGSTSSKLVSPQLGLFRSPEGFVISAGGTDWKQTEGPKDNKFVATMYDSPGTAALTVRIDELKKETTLDAYVQKWMKAYPRYGFDVIGSKAFAQNGNKGFVLDLINRDSKKQLRQVLFLKDKKAVILTCRDDQKKFRESLKGCNQIIKTFAWNK